MIARNGRGGHGGPPNGLWRFPLLLLALLLLAGVVLARDITFLLGPGLAMEGAETLVLANADDDDGDGLPDNWVGGDFDYLRGDEPPDVRVNAFPDEEDLAALLVHRTGSGAFPPGSRYVLRLVRPADEAPYWATVAPEERVRVFMPCTAEANDYAEAIARAPCNEPVRAGDWAILGPEAGDRVAFVRSPIPPQQDLALLAGEGALHLAVEGIRYGAPVEIVLEAWYGWLKVGEDRARLRVAPFLLFDHRQPIARGPVPPQSVYVEDLEEENAALRAALREVYGTHLAETRVLDRWHQDGYEIGYSVAPYGAMWVVLGLPRGQARYATTPYGAIAGVLALPGADAPFDPRTMSSLNHFTRQELLGPDVALIHDFQELLFTEADDGGNLEAIPGQPARILYRADMNAELIRFLEAQGAQPGLPVAIPFLAVGHIDELVSYCPDGEHVLVADPEAAWALLLLAARADPSARMLAGMEPYGPQGVAVGELVADAELRAFNLERVMAPENLPAFLGALGIGSDVSAPVAEAGNAGSARLSRAGGLPGNLSDGRPRTYRVVFDDAERFRATYREGDSGEWTPDGAGDRAHDWVSDDGGAFILAHWWEGSAVEGGAADGGAPAPGDAFRFTVDPGVPWMRIPVLYRQPYEGQGVPLTSNHVNALVDDATILTAQAHGPVVDLGAGPEDVLGGYVARQLRRAGYERIVWLDDRAAYHNLSGSVHCATNAFREIPGASDPSAP